MTEQIGKCPYCGSSDINFVHAGWREGWCKCYNCRQDELEAEIDKLRNERDESVCICDVYRELCTNFMVEIEQLREALADANHIIVHHGTRMMRAHTERIRNINLTLERNAFMERKDEP